MGRQRCRHLAFFLLTSLAWAAFLPAAGSPAEGTVVGVIVIPNVGVRAEILEGTETETLKRAVGHVSRSARLGQKGNICLVLLCHKELPGNEITG